MLGAAATVALVYAMNIRRAKKLSQNAEDLHGSARWATPDDIRATGLLTAKQGVYVGAWHDTSCGRLHYLRHDGPEHILAFAPTRSGKGVGLVIPTLLAWSESTVVYDIKGENWAKTAGFRQSQGHLCFKFSPVEARNRSRFNPLAEVRIGTPRDVSDAQNVADMIVRTGEDSPQKRYWQDAAASITTGMILHVGYAAAAEGRVAELTEIDFQQFLNEHVAAGASRSKLSRLLLYLRNILDHAVIKKLIPANPARNPGYRLKAKSRKAVSGRYLSMEECQRLLAVVSGAHHLAFRIFIHLGLRSEELFALRRNDVVGETLRIDEAIVEGASATVKTEASEAAVYVPPICRWNCDAGLRALARTRRHGSSRHRRGSPGERKTT